MKARTGAERYLEHRRSDPDYEKAYQRARTRIDAVDAVVRALDRQRQALDLSKADLARRAGLQPEVVRRLFGSGSHNPTLATISALAAAVDAELVLRPRATGRRSGDERSQRRSA